MGWEEDLFALFDQIEGEAEALYAADRGPELADRSRAEYQQVTFASRLMASVGTPVRLELVGVGRVEGRLERVAEHWSLVSGPSAAGATDWVIPTAAVTAADGLSERSVPEVAWSPLTRLSFGSCLRRIAESGERCLVHLRSGDRLDGTLRRVGRDFVELRGEGSAGLSLVRFESIAAVRSREVG